MTPVNNLHSAAHVVFSYSCSGTLAFRHNLGFPTGGAFVPLRLNNIKGDAHITAVAANTVTVATTATAGSFEIEPVVYVGDYA